MKRLSSDKDKVTRVDVRIAFAPDDYADLCAAAKVSGLSAAQFGRTIIKNYLNRMYANVERPTDDR